MIQRHKYIKAKNIIREYESQQLNKPDVKSSNAFERLPLHWRLLYYYACGIITGLLLHYCF